MTAPTLVYRRIGNGGKSLLVLMHGWLGNGDDWNETTAAIGDACDVVVVDLPGHGQSGDCLSWLWTVEGVADAVVDIGRREANGKPLVIGGYSMGGRMALVAASRHPSLISGCIVASASPGIDEHDRPSRAAWEAELAERVRREDPATFLDTWYRQPLFGNLAQRPDYARLVERRLARWNREGMAMAAVALGVSQQPNVWSLLNEVPFPVVLMVGEHDEKYVAIAQKAREYWPNADVHVVSGVGHAVHVEASDEWKTCLRSFLTREVGDELESCR